MNEETRSNRHEELAKFLFSRRTSLLPESCGLHPPRRRRRTPGLRRDEVSALAGISTAYYTWIEQGRKFDVSRDVLEAIAEALRLSDVEAAYLFALAGKATPHKPASDPSTNSQSGALRTYVRTFASGPAMLLTPWLEVLESNRIARDVLAIAPGANFAEAILCSAGAPRVVDPDSLAPAFVALLRHSHAIDIENVRFDEVIAALRNGNPAFRTSWDKHVIASMPVLTFELAHRDDGAELFEGLIVSDPIATDHLALLTQPKASRWWRRRRGASPGLPLLGTASADSERISCVE